MDLSDGISRFFGRSQTTEETETVMFMHILKVDLKTLSFRRSMVYVTLVYVTFGVSIRYTG